MSNDASKFKGSRRRHQTDVAIAKQVKIAKSHGLGLTDRAIKEPHRMSKHHVMDCGNPECYLCGNPRKTHKDKLTTQEKKMFQDTDTPRDRHSNGLKNEDDNK